MLVVSFLWLANLVDIHPATAPLGEVTDQGKPVNVVERGSRGAIKKEGVDDLWRIAQEDESAYMCCRQSKVAGMSDNPHDSAYICVIL